MPASGARCGPGYLIRAADRGQARPQAYETVSRRPKFDVQNFTRYPLSILTIRPGCPCNKTFYPPRLKGDWPNAPSLASLRSYPITNEQKGREAKKKKEENRCTQGLWGLFGSSAARPILPCKCAITRAVHIRGGVRFLGPQQARSLTQGVDLSSSILPFQLITTWYSPFRRKSSLHGYTSFVMVEGRVHRCG